MGKTVTVNLKENVHERIKKEADKSDLSIAAIITIAFDEYMRNKYKEVNESSQLNNT